MKQNKDTKKDWNTIKNRLLKIRWAYEKDRNDGSKWLSPKSFMEEVEELVSKAEERGRREGLEEYIEYLKKNLPKSGDRDVVEHIDDKIMMLLFIKSTMEFLSDKEDK